MKTGVELIAEERQRQIEVEGWTAEHDAQHTDESIALAAACYATPGEHRFYIIGDIPEEWPWHPDWWKPAKCEFRHDSNYNSERIRELQKAGALIAAEIDRINNTKSGDGHTEQK